MRRVHDESSTSFETEVFAKEHEFEPPAARGNRRIDLKRKMRAAVGRMGIAAQHRPVDFEIVDENPERDARVREELVVGEPPALTRVF